jgi:hypothetical protein
VQQSQETCVVGDSCCLSGGAKGWIMTGLVESLGVRGRKLRMLRGAGVRV